MSGAINTINVGIHTTADAFFDAGENISEESGQTAQGERVVVSRESSSLVDAENHVGTEDAIYLADEAEELSVAVAESRGRLKTQDEIKAARLSTKPVTLNEAVSELTELMDRMGEGSDQKELETLAKRILQQANSASEMRQMAEERFAEPALQYSLLRYVKAYAEGRGESAVKIAAADEAIAQLEEEQGTAIFALVNTKGAFHGDTARESSLAYRQMVAAEKFGLAEAVKSFESLWPRDIRGLARKDAIAAFTRPLDETMNALGRDMNALQPSRDPELLGQRLQQVSTLQKLSTTLAGCLALWQVIPELGGQKPN